MVSIRSVMQRLTDRAMSDVIDGEGTVSYDLVHAGRYGLDLATGLSEGGCHNQCR